MNIDDLKRRLQDRTQTVTEKRQELKRYTDLNAESSRKLSLVRIVAVIVTICFGIQLYNNYGWKSYLPSEYLRPEKISETISGTGESIRERASNNFITRWIQSRHEAKEAEIDAMCAGRGASSAPSSAPSNCKTVDDKSVQTTRDYFSNKLAEEKAKCVEKIQQVEAKAASDVKAAKA